MTKPKSTPPSSSDPMGKPTAGPWHLGDWIRSERRQPSQGSAPGPAPAPGPAAAPAPAIDLWRQPWTKTAILQAANKILQQIMAVRIPEATEAAIAYARFVRLSG